MTVALDTIMAPAASGSALKRRSRINNIALAAGSTPLDVERVLDALGPQRGMLYFHLLLGRLEACGDSGRQSFETLPSDDQSVTVAEDDSPG